MNVAPAPSPSGRLRRRPSRRVATLSLVAAGLALPLAACGGDDGDGGSTDTTTAVEADLVVTAVPTIRWDKPAYTAPAGEITVALENEDSLRHDLVILDSDDDKVPGLELIAKQKGDSDSGTVTLEPGEYFVYCVIPGHNNMKSTLTVS